MTDMNILVIGIIVFGLMLVGMVLTIVEFSRISHDDQASSDSKASSPTSDSR